MKRSKFTDSQIMAALKRVDVGLAVPEVCREQDRSTATIKSFRKQGLRFEIGKIYIQLCT